MFLLYCYTDVKQLFAHTVLKIKVAIINHYHMSTMYLQGGGGTFQKSSHEKRMWKVVCFSEGEQCHKRSTEFIIYLFLI